jgi:hypothetical protein
MVGAACSSTTTPPDDNSGEGEGEGEAEGEGEGEGEGEREAAGCAVSGCDDDEQCGSLFGDAVAAACFASCTTSDEPCALASGGRGACRVIAAFPAPVCRAESADLDRCGNDVNAGCVVDGSLCAAFQEPSLFADDERVCVHPCTTDDECGDDALGCSFDLQLRVSGTTTPTGVCAPATSTGSPCGRLGDGRLALCTGAQRCDRGPGESQSACVDGG